MRESEGNLGGADNDLAGERSTAEGETQRPNKVVEDDASARGTRGGEKDGDRGGDRASDRDSVRSDSAAMGDEGSANTSTRSGKPERKPNA
jgi:hypothetical protein